MLRLSSHRTRLGFETLFGSLLCLVLCGLIILGLIGWIKNIIQVYTLAKVSGFTTMFVFKVVGIFIPFIGMILGWVGT